MDGKLWIRSIQEHRPSRGSVVEKAKAETRSEYELRLPATWMSSACAHALSTSSVHDLNATQDRLEMDAMSLLRFLVRIQEIMGDLRTRP
jgi:hypothetical protein